MKLNPSAIDTRIRFLSGMLRRMMKGIGYSAKKASRNAEYAEVKYPRSDMTLTGAQEPPLMLLSQPNSTGSHCLYHQTEYGADDDVPLQSFGDHSRIDIVQSSAEAVVCADGDHDAGDEHDENTKDGNEVVPTKTTANLAPSEELTRGDPKRNDD
ncbi:hypothetical protein HG530_001705 [Fusarium avenaceum]|nr:hypothetical protein HG530_001705 [Fusarium avenaceum]